MNYSSSKSAFILSSMTICLFFAIGGTGCYRDFVKPTRLAEVHGKVYLDGQPVTEATVVFVPEDSKDLKDFVISFGKTNSRGEFELKTDDDREGATVGAHRVFISRVDKLFTEKSSQHKTVQDLIKSTFVNQSDVSEIWSIMKNEIKQPEGEIVPFYYNIHSDLYQEVLPGIGIQRIRFDLYSQDPKLIEVGRALNLNTN